MSKWTEYRLDEIGEVIGGGTPSSKIETYWNGNIGWVTPADLSGYQFKYICNGSRNITELGLKNSSAKIHPKNTVLMTSRAPIGYLGIAEKPLATNQGFQSIRCNKEIADFTFVYYLLEIYKEGIALIASGATFPEVSGGKIKQYKIRLPSLSIQKKIAKILSNYDDLIENNLKRIKLLEESARLTYEEWFLRFRVDGKKLEIDSESRLPFGWEIKKIGDYVTYIDNRGKTPPVELKKTEYPLIEVNALNKNNRLVNYNVIKKYVNKETFNNWFRGHPKRYDTLISTVGSIAESSMFLFERGCIAQNIISLHGEKISSFYLFETLKIEKENIKMLNIGGAQPSIKVPHLLNIKIKIPDLNLQKKFDGIIKPISNKIGLLDTKNQLLKEARDILLPRLMTGMIDTDKLDIAI